MFWLTCRACKSVLTGHCFLVRMLWYEFHTFSLHLHFMTRFMLSPSCFIITQSARVIISYCTTLHLFCTFRIGRLYKPCFSAKQKARRSCPAGGASPGGSEFADVQLGGCHMSVQEYARLSALPWASVPQLPIRGHWQATTNSAHTTAQMPRVRCSLHLSPSVDVSDSMTA